MYGYSYAEHIEPYAQNWCDPTKLMPGKVIDTAEFSPWPIQTLIASSSGQYWKI